MKIVVLEIGTNHPGEITYLCDVAEPTHGMITNIGREHLEFFGTIEGAAKAEGELLHWLAAHDGIFLSQCRRCAYRSACKKNKESCDVRIFST